MTSSTEPVNAPAELAAVEQAVRAFAKAYRAMLLYLPNNAMRTQAVDTARAAFASVWQSLDTLTLEVHEARFIWNGAIVLNESERGMDGLPWLLYRDGLRLLRFAPGFERESLDAFLGVLGRVRTMAPDEDDLVTLLWVADLEGLRYSHVEPVSATLGDVLAADASAHGAQLARVISAESAVAAYLGDVASGHVNPAGGADASGESASAATPGVLSVDDFDSTLHFLDANEQEYLRSELQREYESDSRWKVVQTLFDILVMPVARQDRLDALENVQEMLVELVAGAELELVAFLLREARDVAPQLTDDAVRAPLATIPERLSAPGVIEQLLLTISERGAALPVETLRALVAELHPSALRPLLGWLGDAPPSPTRDLVLEATIALAGANTAELSRALDVEDARVMQGALTVIGRLATPAAVPALSRMVPRATPAMRVEIAGVLREIASPGALQALEILIEDPDRDVRLAAYRAIGERKHGAALSRLRAATRRKELRSADLAEKMALFEAFGAVCGDGGVAELDALLNARSLLGAREPVEIRACAARALGIIGSPAAMTALQKASDAKETVVRSAVSRALRGGT